MQQDLENAKAELTLMRERAGDDDAAVLTNSLQQELLEAQQEVIRLKADGSRADDAIMGDAAVFNTGSAQTSSVIAAELEKSYQEKIKQAEEAFKKRGDNLRSQYLQKLREAKDQVRKEVAVEHEQALQELGAQHEKEAQELKAQHGKELETLKKGTIAKSEGEAPSLPETRNRLDPSTWTEAETKDFVSSNDTVKKIIASNLRTKIKEATDQLKEEANQAREAHEKQLQGTIKELEDKKEHAVLMEGKRQSLKLNIAENKLKQAQPKLETVQKAAQETPESQWVKYGPLQKMPNLSKLHLRRQSLLSPLEQRTCLRQASPYKPHHRMGHCHRISGLVRFSRLGRMPQLN